MKKFLSMVLALAMAMSLMTFATVSAGAKDFTDSGSINYKEAVDVISAIQIMDGYADASFNPSGTLTRGAAAKIICNMILGPTTANALPTNVAPFPDVAAGSTFAGYIAYCSEHNIISGYADGNFRPADSLSGYAYLKMLLCALGYDQEIEKYQGANWRVNVAKQALGIGLDDDLIGELDGSRIVTREEAALYAFNTLQADLVEYDTKTTVAVSGATVTVGGNSFHSKTSQTQSSRNNRIDNRQVNIATGESIIQFAEEYFPDLERVPKKNVAFAGGQGDFGEPSTTWTWKGSKVGDYSNTVAKSYTSDVKVSAIYNDLGMTSTSDGAPVYLNGEHVFDIDIRRANDDKLHEQKKNADGAYNIVGGFTKSDGTACDGLDKYADKVDDGTIIQVFYDDDSNNVVICAKSVYPGEVNSVKSASATKDAYIVVDYKGNNGSNYPVQNYKSSDTDYDEFETNASFNEDDIVWFTFSESENKIGEVQKMESVEGKLDRRVTGSSLTLDGTKYDYGKEKVFDFGSAPNPDTSMTNGSSYVIYLDGAGYVLYVEEAEFASEQYALIERITVESGGTNLTSNLNNGIPVTGTSNSWDTNMVKLLMSNGVERTVDLDGASNYRDSGGIKDEFLAGSIVRYVQQSDGTYKLYKISGGASQGRSIYHIDSSYALDNLPGVVNFRIDSHQEYGVYIQGAAATPYPTGGPYIVKAIETNASGNPKTASTDSDTTFVVQDDDTFKVYTGKRNAPNVAQTTNTNYGTVYTVAYAYCTGSGDNRTVKVIFVLQSAPESSSKDITFLAGKSKSDLYEGTDIADYYEYTAMINGTMETIMVDKNVYDSRTNNTANKPTVYDGTGAATTITFDPAWGDKAWNSMILNATNFDGDDVMNKGSFYKSGLDVYRVMGVKRANSNYEIKLGTYDGNFDCKKDGVTLFTISSAERTWDMASNCNIYYVNGDGDISLITYNDIHNDSDDVIYFTYDRDDAEITNLFICDFEP